MWKKCSRCGEEKPPEEFKYCGAGSNGKRYRRNECQECVNNNPREITNYNYICVHDPTNTYSEDSQLTMGQVRSTLKVGYMPPGSKWRCTLDWEVYVVMGNEHWHDILECVKVPDKSYLEWVREEQELVPLEFART